MSKVYSSARLYVVQIRLTAAERDELRARAAAAGLTVSEYVRRVAVSCSEIPKNSHDTASKV